jgi:hypothetical protein
VVTEIKASNSDPLQARVLGDRVRSSTFSPLLNSLGTVCWPDFNFRLDFLGWISWEEEGEDFADP